MGKLIIAFAFVAIILAQGLFASCVNDEKSVFVPAVVGDSGKIVRFTLKTVDGTGRSYFATSPRVGSSTQGSHEIAIRQSIELANVSWAEQCDYLLRVENYTISKSIEGPSASLGIAIAALAILQNKSVRDDAAFSGSIGSEGFVEPVGGLAEKASGVGQEGKKVFVTPRQEAFEKILLSTISYRYGLSIAQVDKLSQAAQIAFSPQSSKVESTLGIPEPKLPENLTDISAQNDDFDLRVFEGIAADLVEQTRLLLQQTQAEGKGEEFEGIMEYFARDVENQQALVKKGYLFTAANNAFTRSADIKSLWVVSKGTVDLEAEKRYTQQCIGEIPGVEMDLGNFEWAAGSSLRKTWAIKRLNETAAQNATNSEEKYFAYRDYIFAQNWCYISTRLAQESGKFAGVKVDQGRLAQLAAKKVAQAKAQNAAGEEADNDLEWHAQAADLSFENRQYAAAIIDAVYVERIGAVNANATKYNSSQLDERLGQLNGKKFESAWAKIYQTQGKYMVQTAKSTGDRIGALKILEFADGLDQSYLEQKGIFRKGTDANGTDLNNSKDEAAGKQAQDCKQVRQCQPVEGNYFGLDFGVVQDIIGIAVFSCAVMVAYLIGKNSTARHRKAK